MVRRRSVVSIVAIAVIAAVLATVAVVYALQTIFETREVTATANISFGGAPGLLVCSDADTACGTAFTGPLAFGNIIPAQGSSAYFHIKNTAPTTGDPANTMLVDARILFNGVGTPLNLSQFPSGGIST